MATHMPAWMLGTDVNTIVLTPQEATYSANKAVLADTATSGDIKDITAYYRTLGATIDRVAANINASSRRPANHVVIEDDFTVEIGIIETHAAEDPDMLDRALTTYDVFKLSFKRGTRTGAILTWTIYATLTNYSFNAEGKGEVTARATFQMIDAINSSGGAAISRVRSVA